MRVLKESFRALCEDGREVMIHEYRDVRLEAHLGGSASPEEVEGAPYYQTDAGDPVSPLGNGRYEVIPTYATDTRVPSESAYGKLAVGGAGRRQARAGEPP